MEDITYRYDHAGRLVEETHSLNRREPVLLCRNTYDELGRLSVSERGVSPSLTTSYTYNVRSWTTGISGPLYGETLHYEDLRAACLPESSRRYGGDVSSAEWRASGDANVRSYDYEYDGLGRLTSAEYGEDGRRLVGYGTSYVYDMNGNVVSLQREGDLTYTSKGTVDDLTMTYDGNRLVGVSDTAAEPQVYGSGDFRDCASGAQEYSYDLNGNLTCDLNAGIRRMTYDAAGYPSEVDRVDGAESYAYLSDGTKLGTVVTRPDRSEVRTDYRGNLVYEGGRLKYLLLDGGLVSMDGRAPEYVLFLKDHLGSTRVSAGPDGTVYQVNHYYPYGLSYATGTTATSQLPVDVGELVELPDLGVAPGVSEEISGPLPPASALRHPYRFLGNELNLERGRPVYDFRARQYDPALGRFQSVDPLSEKYYGMSPYSYCGGSPVRYVDPDGKYINIVYSSGGSDRCFRYYGQNDGIPDNDFVHAVIDMYKYNKTNWEASAYDGLCPSTTLVESKTLGLYVYHNMRGLSQYDRMNGGIPYITIDPYAGMKTETGVVLSPATIFAHEADHAIDDLTDNASHYYRKDTRDDNYDNAEEKRVITGSEQKVAKANGELSTATTSRFSHNGTTVYTLSPTSNEIDPIATKYVRK